MADPSSEGGDLELDTTNLRDLFAKVRGVSPKLATDLRRRLRESGDVIIAKQKATLDEPPPGNAEVTGKRLKLIQGRNRKAYARLVNKYGDKATNRRRHTGMREAIKASIKTRIVAGKTRQGITIRTDQKVAGPMARVWQSQRFRHPVFGDRGVWVIQKGQPYFWGPVYDQDTRAHVMQSVEEAVASALKEIEG